MAKNSLRKQSMEREDELASDVSGKRHKGSGSCWYKKGDVSNDRIFFEDKFTYDPTYSIQLRIIDKLNPEVLLTP
jgi:hypothetical protein